MRFFIVVAALVGISLAQPAPAEPDAEPEVPAHATLVNVST